MKETMCASCRAPIAWAMTPNARMTPIDFEPDATFIDGGTNYIITHEDHGIAQLRKAVKGEDVTKIYHSHFGSCPNAATHSKGKR